MVTLALNDHGFDIVAEGANRAYVRWIDVQEIIAFKLDLLACDTIRIAFRVADSGEHYEIDEDWAGYQELIAEVERRFDLSDGWWEKVVFPAFETNRTTIWRAARTNSSTT